jgi:hypothetical protein
VPRPVPPAHASTGSTCLARRARVLPHEQKRACGRKLADRGLRPATPVAPNLPQPKRTHDQPLNGPHNASQRRRDHMPAGRTTDADARPYGDPLAIQRRSALRWPTLTHLPPGDKHGVRSHANPSHHRDDHDHARAHKHKYGPAGRRGPHRTRCLARQHEREVPQWLAPRGWRLHLAALRTLELVLPRESVATYMRMRDAERPELPARGSRFVRLGVPASAASVGALPTPPGPVPAHVRESAATRLQRLRRRPRSYALARANGKLKGKAPNLR